MKRFCVTALIISLAASFLFWGCDSSLSVGVKKDGSVSGSVSLAIGSAFLRLIGAATGSEAVVFEPQEIEKELLVYGFSSARVWTRSGTDLQAEFSDKTQSSVLFTSGAVSVKDGRLSLVLSPKILSDFYASVDGQLQHFLDLLLAPVFNDELMDEDEYVEVIASFYGDAAAAELEQSFITIRVENADSSKNSVRLPLVQLLTLKEKLVLF